MQEVNPTLIRCEPGKWNKKEKTKLFKIFNIFFNFISVSLHFFCESQLKNFKKSNRTTYFLFYFLFKILKFQIHCFHFNYLTSLSFYFFSSFANVIQGMIQSAQCFRSQELCHLLQSLFDLTSNMFSSLLEFIIQIHPKFPTGYYSVFLLYSQNISNSGIILNINIAVLV